MKKLGLMMVMALAIGCGDDDGRGSDSGLTFDAGGSSDAGATDTGIVLMDSGNPMPDAGAPMDAGAACTPGLLPVPSALTADQLPRCAAATLTCLMGCTDQTCQNNCVMADTTAPVMVGMQNIDCGGCLSNQGVSCAVANGCADQWTAIDCCAQANSCRDVACIQANCAAEFNAFGTCQQGVGATCAPAQQMCFAPAG